MSVDHAEVLRRLKGVIASKPSHGQRDLLADIGRLEAECSTEDDQYRRFIRRFGDEVEEAVLNLVPPPGGSSTGADVPLTEPAASGFAMAASAPPSIGAASVTKESTTCRTAPRPAARAASSSRTATPARATS